MMKIPVVLCILILCSPSRSAEETPSGKGLSDANKERLVIDDMADVADWYNGSPDETVLSRSDRGVEGAKSSLAFANIVDHTKGEKNYPIGWPRTGKDLARQKLTDWSDYDFFECWVYAETSRAALPGAPLAVGFYHSGPKRNSSVPLKQLRKDEWVKIIIPIADLAAAADVQRIQFNISESDYKHGDRVVFYIADVVLTRFVEPAIAELRLQRKLVYASDAAVIASSKLAGRKGIDDVVAEFEIGRDGQSVARTTAPATRHMEHWLSPGHDVEPGEYWARISLRGSGGKLIDRKQLEFRVIRGPF